MQEGKWIVLGSGGGEATPDRASSGHLLETPGATVLFDCGEGITASFLRARKRVEDLDAIFISHTHPDHMCGLSFLLQQMYLAVRRRELVLYLPGESIDGLKSYLKLSYLFLDQFPFPIAFIALTDSERIAWRDVTVVPQANTHLTRHRGQPWMAKLGNAGECYSFEILCRSKKLAYSADVGSIDDLAFCEGAEVLITEATHITLPQLFASAETWRIKHIVLTHLGPEFDPGKTSVARESFSGRITIAADGLSIPLGD